VQSTLIRVFRIGPVLLLPFIILWGQACNRIGADENYDWWRSYPIYAAAASAAIWHLALVVTEGQRLHYTLYAVAHLPILLFTSFLQLIHATRAPL
jgi:hypothetical protein